MVRPAQVGRSRGCRPCRTRRIKCDLTQPKCQRCLESGRDCPGPLTGVLIIQAGQTPGGKMRGKLLPSSNLKAQQTRSANSQPDLFALVKFPSQAELAEDNLLSRFLEFFSKSARRSSWTLKLPQLKNNPDAHALRSSLRAVSLAYFAHITQDRAVQVESLRHYGQSLARQRSALTRLPSFFDQLPSSLDSGGIDIDGTTNALLATVILSYFELISPSGFVQQIPSSTAWINHTLASERLIAMLGPQSVSNDIIGQLFFSIRSHAVHRAAVLGHYTVFCEKEWLEAAARYVPKQSYARTAYDRVTEWILRLCKLRSSRDRSGNIGVQQLIFEPAMKENEDSAESLLEELKRRYHTFLKICRQVPVKELPLFIPRSGTSLHSPATRLSPYSRGSVSTIEPPAEDLLPQQDVLVQEDLTRVYCMTTGVLTEGPAELSDLHPKLQKLFAAMTTAYFHAAAILLQTYLPDVSKHRSSRDLVTELGATGPEDLEEDGTEQKDNDIARGDAGWDTLYNARVILAAGKYLSSEGRSNGTAVLRMMLPFSVVWHFCQGDDEAHTGRRGPREGRREGAEGEAQLIRLEAKKLFADWCGREGMSGLVAVGFAELS